MSADGAEMEDMPGAALLPPTPSAAERLPTLQRNALRKIFNRLDFYPEEVAALGYRRLQQAEGIGQKGLNVISAWLRDYGFVLEAHATQRKSEEPLPKKTRRNLESAMRLLNSHGYVVHRQDEKFLSVSGDERTPSI